MSQVTAAVPTWFFQRENSLLGTVDTIGPISEPELLALVREGNLKRKTIVCSQVRTGGNWLQLQQVPHLLQLLEEGERERQAQADAAKEQKRELAEEARRQRAAEAARRQQEQAEDAARQRHQAILAQSRPQTQPQDPPISLLDIFDFQFTRYVTPLIIKLTWILALCLAAVWLVVAVIGTVTLMFPESRDVARVEPERIWQEDSDRAQERNKAIPEPISERRDGANEPTQEKKKSAAEEQAEVEWAKATRRVSLGVAFAVSQVIGIVLTVLWVRVVLEFVIVVFHIASSLRSIDRKTVASGIPPP